MTTDPNQLDAVIAALRARGAVDDPVVAPLESVIRSGEQFLFPTKLKWGPGGVDPINDKFDAVSGPASGDPEYDPSDHGSLNPADPAHAPYLGTLVIEWGYDIRPKQNPNTPETKHKDFRQFLEDNEALGAADAPHFVRYRGTYAVFSSTEKQMGQYRTVWSFRGWRGLNKMSQKLAIAPNSPFSVFVLALKQWQDDGPGAHRSQQIYVVAAAAHNTGTSYP